jgi:hypothetical protein
MKSLIFLLVILHLTNCKKAKEGEKPEWTKKDIRDYTDEDMHRLLEQWEEDDEPIPVDELPDGHPDKPRPQVDWSKVDMSNPENVVKVSKKGQTVMLFVKVNNFVSKEETEEVTALWQTGLFNAHIEADRFPLEDDRIMYVFKDGEAAWEAKEYFLDQERVEDVQLEQKTYYGKHCVVCGEEKKPTKEKKKEKKSKKAKKAEKTEL